MEAASTRICERDGCENPVTGKATARFCSPSCRREHNRVKGDGNALREWVPGRWVTRRPRGAQRRRRGLNPALTPLSPVLAVLDAHTRAQVQR